MRNAVVLGVACLASACPSAFAQTNAPAPHQSAGLDQQITDNLKQAGFKDITVVPNSFVIQATDKSGNPVTMFLRPDAMTMVSEQTVGGNSTQNSQPENFGSFVKLPPQEELSSQIVGLDVYNNANQKIGKISNIAFQGDKLRAYVVGVGGFIGLGEHDVAVKPSAIALNYDASGKKWRATTQLTADQLKSAPDAMRIDAQPSTDNNSMFAAIEQGDDLSSRVTNISVYNASGQNIGTLKDIAFDKNTVRGYILGVGGFLSVGERYVAVQPSALKLTYSANDRKWHAEMDATADQLKGAPQYRYASSF